MPQVWGGLDVAVHQHQVGAALVRLLDPLHHLGAGGDAQLGGNAALERRHDQRAEQQHGLLLADDLDDIGALPLLAIGDVLEARLAQLDAHGVRLHRLDGVTHVLHALLGDVGGAYQVDLTVTEPHLGHGGGQRLPPPPRSRFPVLARRALTHPGRASPSFRRRRSSIQ